MKYQNYTSASFILSSSLLHRPQLKTQIIENTHVLFIYPIYLTTIPRRRSFECILPLEIFSQGDQLLSYLLKRQQTLFSHQLSSLSLRCLLLSLTEQVLAIIDDPFIGLVESHEFLLDLVLLVITLYPELVGMTFQCAFAISLAQFEIGAVLFEMQQLIAVADLQHLNSSKVGSYKFDN